MPYQPSQPDFSLLFNLMQRNQEEQRYQERTRKQEAETAFNQALDLVNSGVASRDILPYLRQRYAGFDYAGEQAVIGIEKALKQKQKLSEDLGSKLPQLQNLETLRAGATDPSVRQQAESQLGPLIRDVSVLQQGQNPELQERINASLLASLQAGQTAALGAREERTQAIAVERRQEAKESRTRREAVALSRNEQIVEAIASRKAQARLGMLPPDTGVSNEAIESELIQQGGISPAEAVRMRRQADILSYPAEASLRLQGRTTTQARSYEETVADTREELASMQASGALPADTVIPDRDVRAIARGKKILDPFATYLGMYAVEDVASNEDAAKTRLRRSDQLDMFRAGERIFEAYGALETAVREGRVDAGPLKTERFWDYMSTLAPNQIPPELSAYRVAYIDFLTSLIKSRSGAQTNELEFRNYMAMMPLLTEIGTGAAEGKLQGMRRMAGATAVSPGVRRELARIRAQNDPAAARAGQTLRQLETEFSQDLFNPKSFDAIEAAARKMQRNPQRFIPRGLGPGVTANPEDVRAFEELR